MLILDFGSQYAQLIARRVREAGAFSLLVAPDMPLEKLREHNPKGIILSGGPSSINEEGSPRCDDRLFELGVPVLGICYGMQLGCHLLGCDIEAAEAREYGRSRLSVECTKGLLANIPQETAVWMSHGDRVESLPPRFRVIAETPNAPLAGMADEDRRFYGLQFHPEVTHTTQGRQIIERFVHEICGCGREWTPDRIIDAAIPTYYGTSRIIGRPRGTGSWMSG